MVDLVSGRRFPRCHRSRPTSLRTITRRIRRGKTRWQTFGQFLKFKKVKISLLNCTKEMAFSINRILKSVLLIFNLITYLEAKIDCIMSFLPECQNRRQCWCPWDIPVHICRFHLSANILELRPLFSVGLHSDCKENVSKILKDKVLFNLNFSIY